MILARPSRLLGLVFLFVLVPLGMRPLWIPDESRYAEIAREMLESGNWVVPRLLRMDYFEKPVGGYWFTALSQAVFGETVFASRLPVALATALSALAVGVIAQRMWHDSRKSAIAALIYLSCALVSGMAMYITLDPQLACWLNLALLAFYVATTTATAPRRLGAWAAMGAACGMAFLSKGFVAWVIVLLVAGPFMLWQRRLGELLRYGPIAIAVAVAVAAPWAVAVHLQAPDFWNFFFWNEHIRRFAATDAQHAQPFWFYLPVLLLGCLPWAGFLLPAWRRAWSEKRDAHIALLVIWLVCPLVFLSFARGKLPTYVLPCFTPLALLLAHALHRQIERGDLRWIRGNAAGNAAVGVLGVLALVVARQQGIYAAEDATRWLFALALCGLWLGVALAQWWRPLRWWELSALPPLLAWASIAGLLPQNQIDSKQPTPFIQAHMATLRKADALLVNDSGVSTNLAWDLGRTDISVYAGKEEFAYGLGTPAGKGRFVPREEVAGWIAAARRRGSVAVVLRITEPDHPDLTSLPDGATERDVRNRFVLMFYPRATYPRATAP